MNCSYYCKICNRIKKHIVELKNQKCPTRRDRLFCKISHYDLCENGGSRMLAKEFLDIYLDKQLNDDLDKWSSADGLRYCLRNGDFSRIHLFVKNVDIDDDIIHLLSKNYFKLKKCIDSGLDLSQTQLNRLYAKYVKRPFGYNIDAFVFFWDHGCTLKINGLLALIYKLNSGAFKIIKKQSYNFYDLFQKIYNGHHMDLMDLFLINIPIDYRYKWFYDELVKLKSKKIIAQEILSISQFTIFRYVSLHSDIEDLSKIISLLHKYLDKYFYNKLRIQKDLSKKIGYDITRHILIYI